MDDTCEAVERAAAHFEFPGYRVLSVVQALDECGEWHWALRVAHADDATGDWRCFTPEGWLKFWRDPEGFYFGHA